MARRGSKKKQDPKEDLGFDDGSDFLGYESGTDWVEEESEAVIEEKVTEEEENAPGQLAVDIFESKEKLYVRARVAGVTKDRLDVTLADNTLTIAGSLEPSEESSVTGYFVQECYWGQFVRTISLPVQVKEEDISAQLVEGVLTVSFTKVKQDIVRKINII